MQNWFREEAARAPFVGDLRFDEPLSQHTYYRIGGAASVFAAPKTLEDLRRLARGIRTTGIPYFVLGAGSNLLVSDLGFQGLVIRAGRLNLDIAEVPGSQVGEAGEICVRTGGSVAVSTLLRRASSEGWGGFELLTGIPGSIGGVVTMNAGTHLGEAKDRLVRVEAFDLSAEIDENSRVVFEADQLRFDYRRNHFLPPGCIVWSADWRVRKEEPSRVKALIDETLARRKATQPIDYPSCGSVFKNPREKDLRAWQVIEKLGLRGHQIGGAQFSEKHPNFIVNRGGAKAVDVSALIELAKARALSELGVQLEEEVMYLPSLGLGSGHP